MAGANLIYGPGMLESGITFDFAQLVLDNEFARMIKQTMKNKLIRLGLKLQQEEILLTLLMP